jgi:hypothetical protein
MNTRPGSSAEYSRICARRLAPHHRRPFQPGSGAWRTPVGIRSPRCAKLTDDNPRAEASELIRGLVERVEFKPVGGALAIDLHGRLAGILNLAAGNKKPAPDVT